MDRVADRWQAPERAQHYAERRFAGRAARRDPRCIEKLLAGRAIEGPILDVPCGTGRLRADLERLGPYVGLDRSPAMLERAGSSALLGDAAALPLRSGSFGLVVSCRLLHHLAPDAALDAVVAELVRVSSGLVIASFWDAHSWGALRRRRGWSRGKDARRAIEKRRLEAAFERAGARIVAYRHTLRFVSQQCFALAEKRRA